MACARHGFWSVEVDLIYARFQPVISEPDRELSMSVAAFREKFQQILVQEDILPFAIVDSVASFQFDSDHWPIMCSVAILTNQFGKIEVAVDGHGNPIDISDEASQNAG